MVTITKMTERIHVSAINEAIQLSVPYDLHAIVHAFYTVYGTLALEGDEQWSFEYLKQKRYMTLEQIFQNLSKFTNTLQERTAICERFIGHLSIIAKIPYEIVEESAKMYFR